MKKETQRIVLLITVGAQDVKLWKHADDGPALEQIPRPDLREKHLEIRDNPAAWKVLSAHEAEDFQDSGGVPTSDTKSLVEALDCSAPLLAKDGRLGLAVPKIEPIVEGIIALGNAIEVVGALVFFTERLAERDGHKTDSRDYENEPVSSGPVVATYLLRRFNLDADQVNVVNCLEGCAGRYEGGLNEHDDFPLRRAIVHRMDSAVQAFLARQGEGFARSVVPATMTTGGIDAFKQVVPAIAELRFASAVRDLSAPETRGADAPQWHKLIRDRLCTETPRITRHEAILARGRALDLLRGGDPVSAWAAVHRFEGSELDKWWLRPLAMTAEYFGGAGSAAGAQPEATPAAPENAPATEGWRKALDEVALDVEDEFEKHKRYAFNAAMRVELALQGKDKQSRRYADALSAVSTMIDAAVIASAILFLKKRTNSNQIEAFIGSNNRKREDFFLKKNSDVPNNSRDAWFGRWSKKEKKENPDLRQSLLEHFEPLITLDSLLGFNLEKDGPSLRSLRNSASHRALSLDDINLIAELAEHEEVTLWNPPGPRPSGQHALGMLDGKGAPAPICAVLESIGVEAPADYYQRLMGGLESILLTCEPESP